MVVQEFTEEEMKAMFASGSLRDFEVGEEIVTEGTPGHSMFLMIAGDAEARVAGSSLVRRYSRGQYFGELSFINPGHARSATVVAVTRVRVQVLDKPIITTLMSTHPEVVFTLLRRTCAFLVDAERALISDLSRRNEELTETLERLDLTRRRLGEEEASARSDALTSLSNRRAFEAEAPGLLERARAINKGLCVLAIDLDHFKPVNDTLGHAAGDAVLKAVGAILRQKVRSSDLPCRVGGDEFIVVLVDVESAAARAKAELLCAAIGACPHPGTEHGLRVTTTVGGAMYRPGEPLVELMRRADHALYEAKNAGRNRVGWAP